jgi:hypothetical protein
MRTRTISIIKRNLKPIVDSMARKRYAWRDSALILKSTLGTVIRDAGDNSFSPDIMIHPKAWWLLEVEVAVKEYSFCLCFH